ncbi:MCE family protein [Bacteroides sp. 214]|uniref:MlaD family protein n=1 Tax=Bacteroides sp. 214 TaxID=2302935 RepID=UPI0013D483BD|nr:MlaD family protein [Bacteroides sp. 214]NDW11731.1 MCE family protein [Bacteroides sp. 214]
MKLAKYFTKEVRIGIVAIVALIILFYGINYLKGVQIFTPSSYFYVKYTNISGLTKSSPVFADGYKVGVVHDIEYDLKSPGNVIVAVEIDKDMRIPKGSSAEIVTDMLGGVKMNLLLVNNLRESHAVGDTIPGTMNNGIMETVAAFVPKIETMLPKLDSILTGLNTLIRNENIPATLESVKNITANLEITTSSFNHLLQKDIPQITGKLNTISDNFVEISSTLKEMDLTGMYTKIDQTLANVKQFTENLNNPDNTIGLLLNDPQLYNNLNSTATNASMLLEDLKNHPKRYVHFSLFGRKK